MFREGNACCKKIKESEEENSSPLSIHLSLLLSLPPIMPLRLVPCIFSLALPLVLTQFEHRLFCEATYRKVREKDGERERYGYTYIYKERERFQRREELLESCI